MTLTQPTARGPSGRPRRWPFRVGVALLVVVLVPTGLAVQAFVAFWAIVALSPTHHHDLGAGWLSDGGQTLGVTYMHGECEVWRRAHLVEESAERVVVAVTYKSDPGSGVCVLIGYEKVSYFTLEQPLAGRPVFYESDEGLRPIQLGAPIPPRARPPTEFRIVSG